MEFTVISMIPKREPDLLPSRKFFTNSRFFIVAALLYKFGAPIKEFIDKYFNLLATLFILLLVGGFVIIKYLL